MVEKVSASSPRSPMIFPAKKNAAVCREVKEIEHQQLMILDSFFSFEQMMRGLRVLAVEALNYRGEANRSQAPK
jgi:hypothetical protein